MSPKFHKENCKHLVSSAIIKSCKQKNKAAYKALYESCIPYVFSVVKRYILVHEDRKDIVQETFAKVFLKLEAYDPNKGEFKGWLRRITVNECLMFLRKGSNMKMYSIDDQIETSDPASTTALDNLTRDDIIDLLEDMPERYKMVFMAYIIDGYDHTEIGKMLGISKDTSRSQLSRAKKWILKHIANDTKFRAYGLF